MLFGFSNSFSGRTCEAAINPDSLSMVKPISFPGSSCDLEGFTVVGFFGVVSSVVFSGVTLGAFCGGVRFSLGLVNFCSEVVGFCSAMVGCSVVTGCFSGI